MTQLNRAIAAAALLEEALQDMSAVAGATSEQQGPQARVALVVLGNVIAITGATGAISGLLQGLREPWSNIETTEEIKSS